LSCSASNFSIRSISLAGSSVFIDG
jgi:hypothetical protein